MRAVVIYESMYSNTHQVAEAIGRGLGPPYDEVVVVAASNATPDGVRAADLLVIGAPTHAHGIPSPATRRAASANAQKPGSGVAMDPAAAGPGVRELLEGLGSHHGPSAAFDTRVAMPRLFSGQAGKGIARSLRRTGRTVTDRESFVVDNKNHLRAGELDRARAWGRQLASQAVVHADSR